MKKEAESSAIALGLQTVRLWKTKARGDEQGRRGGTNDANTWGENLHRQPTTNEAIIKALGP